VEDECAARDPEQDHHGGQVSEERGDQTDDEEAAQEVRQVEKEIADGRGVGAALLAGEMDPAGVRADVVRVGLVGGCGWGVGRCRGLGVLRGYGGVGLGVLRRGLGRGLVGVLRWDLLSGIRR
jgi:hypothetical protein